MHSTNREDYLRALYVLEERHGEIKSKDISDYLKVSKPSVTEMVDKLQQEGLVTQKKYSNIRFTPKGRRAATKLTSKHRIIELFLTKTLRLNPNKVHHEAHLLEHAFSNKSIVRIKKLLGNPKTDPHGKPIPQVKM